MTMNLFIPITKVDAVQRLVYGSLATEAVDKTGEIFDYETSKPHVEKWSGDIAKATDGKSVGNLRAMHGKTAAGKFTELTCNDVAKRVDVCAKVVDNDEWEKVAEGVYTGFSIGGSYVKKWKDGEHTRYTANPSEGSLVDNPANPESQFAMIKEGGAQEMRKFHVASPATSPPDPELEQVWKAKDGQTFATKALAKAHNEEVARLAADPGARLENAVGGLGAAIAKAEEARTQPSTPAPPADPVAKKDFTDKKRAKLADEGKAMPDGSFPIENKDDLKNAIQAYGRAKNKKAAKAHITARAKALDAEDMLPDSWKPGADKAARFGELRKGLVVGGKVLRKGMYGVARLASLIEELEHLQQSCEWEAEQEKDESEVPNEMKGAIATICGILRAMVEEETSELLDDEEMLEFGEELEMSARTRGVNALAKVLGDKAPAWLAKVGARHSKGDQEHLDAAHDHLNKMAIGCGAPEVKAAGGDLGKAGARHSKADAEHLTKAHDHMVEAGAECQDEEPEEPEKAATGGDLAKVTAERDSARATLEKTIPAIELLTKRVQDLEAQPMPHPRDRAGATYRVVSKTDDVASLEKSVEAMSDAEKGDLVLRAILRNPKRIA